MKKAIRILAVILAVFMLSTTVLADNFTPSVEQKESPEVVTTTDSKGEEVAAVITDSENKEVAGVPVGEIVVTSVAGASKATEEIKEVLQAAQKQIKEATKIEELIPEQKEELTKAVEDAGLKVENLVVRDLIDVTLTGEYKDHLDAEGNTITLTFKLGIGANEFLKVLHNYEADKWEMIASDRVKVQENGDVSVTFDSLSPIAFVVDKAEHAGPVEPAETPWVMYALIAAAVVVVVVIVVLVVARKKKPAEAAKTE